MTRRRAAVTVPGGLTRDQLLALPAVVPLWPVAGQAWGLKRNSTYELAHRGEFPCPVRRLGNRWVVVTEQLLDSLGIHRPTDMSEAAPTTRAAAATTAEPTGSSRENDKNERSAGRLHSA